MSFASFDLAAFEAASGEDRRAKARKLDEICRGTGFLVLENHGIPLQVTADIWQAAKGFFAQTGDQKQSVAAPYPGYPYGYLGANAETLARSKGEVTPPDLKESFNGGPLRLPAGMTDPDALAFCYQPTHWPNLPGFRAAWTAYYTGMETLAARIMTAFAAALRLPETHFAPFITTPISALRALNYPASTTIPLDKQQRAGAHTDYGTLTILKPQPGSQGLQIARNGHWIDVPAPENGFVINIGDLMARWTADRWVSTLHRVVAKPDQPARQSLAYFHLPNWGAKITPLDGSDSYPPVQAGPYLVARFRATTV